MLCFIIPVLQFYLEMVYNGRHLEGSSSLQSYGIKNGSCINVIAHKVIDTGPGNLSDIRVIPFARPY